MIELRFAVHPDGLRTPKLQWRTATPQIVGGRPVGPSWQDVPVVFDAAAFPASTPAASMFSFLDTSRATHAHTGDTDAGQTGPAA